MKHIYKLFILVTFLLSFQISSAQLAVLPVRGAITGKIKTNDGKPAAFVSVQIVENGRKTLSNEEGTFTFNNLKTGSYTLKTSFVGLQVQTQRVSVTEGQTTTVEFALTENAAQLNEVAIN